MFTFDKIISPDDAFDIEKTVSYLVTNYNASGHNSKPVILHSLRVAHILMEMGYSKKIVTGAVLHDVLEDTSVTAGDVRKEFGEEICDLVVAVSYDRSISDPIEQYQEMYNRVLTYGREAVVLKAVDIAINSLYIHLVSDIENQIKLIEKGSYFLNLTKAFSNEPAWQLLERHNLKERARVFQMKVIEYKNRLNDAISKINDNFQDLVIEKW